MKTNLLKYTSLAAFLVFVIACSTKRNSFVSRNSHALSSKYNILYNGGLALDKGVADLKFQYKDNFWERLPIERMQIKKDAVLPGEQKVVNADFERAETKATKAIQKHSMNIGGSEKNPQMDEAHLMLGKARYYDQRFVPALEAFNYILYKYPNSDKIYEAKIWREKTNMRLDNDAVAVTNLGNLLKEIKLKNQVFADANAALTQAYLNLGMKDSAVAKLKLARDFTKENEEKSRYRYILGQLYEELGYKDSAFASYQEVIDMKRQAARQYVIHAHMRQAAQFDYTNGDTLAFVEKYNKMLKDRENRPYLDALNHQMALFYDKQKNFTQAKKYYNRSLKTRSEDQYMAASNYRNLADIYFNDARYVTAGKYYDSTMVQLDPRTREFKAISKKRENLVDVIKYEAIATRNDSILTVYAMPEAQRVAYYGEYIEKLKKQQELLRKQKEKEAAAGANQNDGQENLGEIKDTKISNTNSKNATGSELSPEAMAAASKKAAANASQTAAPPPSASVSGGDSNFYFYNPTTVAFGRNEFKKQWGDRAWSGNWRVSALKGANKPADEEIADAGDETDAKANEAKSQEMLTPEFYIKQLPTTQKEIDSIGKERNFAYYQLGVIYKEKFSEYKLAAAKLEKLLENKPEERLILPSMYNLYKIYEILGDKDKALAMKDRITREYPDSRYAQILLNPDADSIAGGDSPQVAYEKLFRIYESGDYKKVLTDAAAAVDRFTGDEMVPKFELLKANTTGKLKGLEEYKKALNFVALNYPNSEEGKKAESMLAREIVWMEALQFNSKEPLSWKILYKADNLSDNKTIALYGKIVKFVKERAFEKITVSIDTYTMTQNFIVIHGMKTEDHAKGIASILREFKEYKVQETPYVISNENYKVVQIKKNFEEFLKVGNGPIVAAAQPNLPPAPEDKVEAPVQKAPEPNREQERERQPMKTGQQNQNDKTKQQQQMFQPDQMQPGSMAPPGSMMPPGMSPPAGGRPPRDEKPKR